MLDRLSFLLSSFLSFYAIFLTRIAFFKIQISGGWSKILPCYGVESVSLQSVAEGVQSGSIVQVPIGR
jgi:hypothetical protein